MTKKTIKEMYKEAIDVALEEIRKNGFDSIWVDDQRIASATITIHIEPNSIVYVTYNKDVYPSPLTAIVTNYVEGKKAN